MSAEYRPASAAAAIGQRLVNEHHTHLVDVRIEYVFRDTAKKKAGKELLGTAAKVTGLNAWLATDLDERATDPEEFFVIELAEDKWVDLDDKQRVALVDHELSHCWAQVDEKSDELVLSIVSHDMEEFVDVVRRHGLWEPSLEHFVKVGAEQLELGA